jgi:hypothetical protein
LLVVRLERFDDYRGHALRAVTQQYFDGTDSVVYHICHTCPAQNNKHKRSAD